MQLITFTLLLDIVWHILIFLVPFILLRVSARLAAIEKTTGLTTRAALFACDDAALPEDLLCEKYSIRSSQGAYFYNGASYNSFQSALEAAKSNLGL